MADAEPTWAVTLQALYEKGMAGDTFDKYGYHPLSRQIAIAEEVGRDSSEVARSISKMIDVGLINDVPIAQRRRGYTLTEKGFDVAHNRSLQKQEKRREQKMEKRQYDANRAIGVLTLGLVFVGVLRATISALVGTDAEHQFIHLTLVIGSIVVVVLVLLLAFSGMLSPWNEELGELV
jgi:DNA-binding MarR family transcriptional regulator